MASNLAKVPIRFRPHAKTHKSTYVAKQQLNLGAVGTLFVFINHPSSMAAVRAYNLTHHTLETAPQIIGLIALSLVIFIETFRQN